MFDEPERSDGRNWFWRHITSVVLVVILCGVALVFRYHGGVFSESRPAFSEQARSGAETTRPPHGDKSITAGEEIYRNNRFKYAVKLPEKWHVILSDPPDDADVGFGLEPYGPLIVVRVFKKDGFAREREALRLGITLQERERGVDGVRAREVSLGFKQTRETVVFFEKGEFGYFIYANEVEAEGRDVSALLDRMLDTFQFLQ
jgi:hypothetical protein